MLAKLISLEGADSSGKSTQIQIIEEYLKNNSLSFIHFHFPMYGHNLFSEIIAKFLRGEFGKIDEVDPYFIATAFAMDRFKFLPELKQSMEENDVIILDRYVFSNMAYQGCKLKGNDSELIKNWIYKFEFSFLKLPYPDLNLFFDVPLFALEERLKARTQNETREYLKNKIDIHENDLEFQNNVKNTYLNLIGFPNFKIVPCAIDKKLLTPIEIFNLYKSHLDEVIFDTNTKILNF